MEKNEITSKLRQRALRPLLFLLLVTAPLLLTLLYSKVVVGGPTDDQRQLLQQAATAVKQKDWENAAALYTHVMETGFSNPAVRFNLGLCSEKTGATGRAIYQFRKILAENPSDQGAKLRLAALGASLGTEYGGGITIPLSKQAVKALFLTAYIVFWVGLYLGRASFWASGGLASLVLGSFVFFLQPLPGHLDKFTLSAKAVAVVLTPATVYSGTDEATQAVAKLPDGTELEIVADLDSWIGVELSSGRRGWVARDQVGILANMHRRHNNF